VGFSGSLLPSRSGALAVLLSVAVLAASASTAAAGVSRLGAAAGGTALEIVLPLKVDAAGLKSFASAVSDPRSAQYARYLSVAELARRFGAAPGARARVIAYLRGQGATAVRVDATGFLAEATVTAALAQRLFGTRLARFSSAGGPRFVAPSSTPTLPSALGGLVEGVVGLDTQPLRARSGFSTRLRASGPPANRASPRAHAAAQTPSELPRSGSPTGCPAGLDAGADGNPGLAGFTPNQYLTAYDFAPLQSDDALGQGERVALVEIDGFNPADVAAFAKCFNLRTPRITTFGVGSVKRALPPGGESTLDLEVLDAAAPALSGIDVYETRADPSSVLKALVAPLQVRGRKPQVVSASLGLCERDQAAATGQTGIETAERLLQLATASGVSYLAASGDNGSADCTDSSGSPRYELGVNYPASSWWVTGVGGTNLALTAANRIANQVVWNDTTNQVAAGGGGLSDLFFRPPYQKGYVRSDSRGVPDVSMLADLVPGYAIYCTAPDDCLTPTKSDPWLSVGGTSAATPLLAGGIALIDEQLRRVGRADVGFANPLLYMLGGSRSRSSVFSDVTAIGNDLGPYLSSGPGRALGCCSAKSGYDLASGWGSVDISHFALRSAVLLPYILGAIKLSLPAHQRPAARHQILADVTCSRACYMAAFAKVQIGRKSFLVDSSIVNRPHGGRRTLALRFSASQRRAIASALEQEREIVATVYGVIVDPEGNIQRQTAGRRLGIGS
jgi:subtilase family serine protease